MYTKKQNQIRTTRTLAFLTCAIFIIVTFFSILFIAKEADHDCTGESCSVCACIHQAEQALKQLGAGTTEITVYTPVLAQYALALVCVFLVVPFTTLTSQKVRLND